MAYALTGEKMKEIKILIRLKNGEKIITHAKADVLKNHNSGIEFVCPFEKVEKIAFYNKFDEKHSVHVFKE